MKRSTNKGEERISQWLKDGAERAHRERLGSEAEPGKARTIADCEACSDLADRAFESGPAELNKIAVKFLTHVIHDHTDELMALLAEKYVPIFMAKRAMR